ncbi:hypothetical protein [Cystobacter ferrugineus]|uniref:Uncharacterized protein n=1 Tax=Cystobacter ferrugineus TaxID=83449 RepID=A0A1L9B739_9BACT|nr:hypothetical protein [Cystobacter ferrugineus]OJH38079.1 hypothetical protein BON30_23225 [Cystobacter ferrugineus]
MQRQTESSSSGGMGRRTALLLLGTLVGINMGVAGDLLAGDYPVSFKDVAAALVLSPFMVTCGGVHVARGSLSTLFMVGGFLFWPVYALLARGWLKSGKPWVLMVTVLWCAQGFFKVVLRSLVILSV